MNYHEVGEEDLKVHLRDFTRLKQVSSKRLTSRLHLMAVLMSTFLLLHGKESRFSVLSAFKLCLERNEGHLSGHYILSKMKKNSKQISLKSESFCQSVYLVSVSSLWTSDSLTEGKRVFVLHTHNSLQFKCLIKPSKCCFLREFVQRSLIMFDKFACNICTFSQTYRYCCFGFSRAEYL
jgi:hypothetical protein